MEISFPFRLGPSGAVATESETEVVLHQHLMTLIATNLRERVMLADYGSNIRELVFRDVHEAAQELTAYVRRALSQWISSLELVSIKPLPSPQQEGLVGVQVDYRIQRTAQPTRNAVHTAIIRVGGNVRDI